MAEPRTERQNEPRSFGRLPLGIPARLETIHGRKSVRLVDLSQGGAHLVVPGDFLIRDCVLTWLNFEAFCSAAWRKGDQLGLTFDTPLALATLLATRNVAPSIIREESMGERAAAQAWVSGQLHLGADR